MIGFHSACSLFLAPPPIVLMCIDPHVWWVIVGICFIVYCMSHNFGKETFFIFDVDYDFYAVPAVFDNCILPYTPVQRIWNKIALLPSKI